MNAITDLDTNLLQALDALLTDRNVTRAADRLGISQPALSARLTRLRSLLDDRLFIPSPNGRGVVPTPRAIALAPLVTSVLGQIAAMLEPSQFEPATSTRIFTLAMHENPAVMLGPDFVRGVQAVAPQLRLRIAIPDKERLPALLENGEVDIYVGVRASTENAWITRILFEDEFFVAQRKGHPRGAGQLDLDSFCALPHLLVSAEGDPFFGIVDTALAGIARSRRVALSIQSYALAPPIIAGSDLLCILPQRFLRHYVTSLDIFELPVALDPVQVSANWHPRHQDDPAHQWLRKQVFAAVNLAARR